MVERYSRKRGFAPSVREIAKEMRLSPSGVVLKLRTLETVGAIVRTAGVSRSIRIVRITRAGAA
jgi:DNA-binding MarR family transcriptional regulator